MIVPLLADYFCKSNHLSFLEPWFFYSHITFSIDDQVLFYLSSKEARISLASVGHFTIYYATKVSVFDQVNQYRL